MALNDAVPSSATDVFKRNAEDADKLLNATGDITTRTGKILPSWDEITQSHAAWNNRGAWTTATAYAVNDIWEDGGVWYVVLSAYTSGASAAADIAGPSVIVLSGGFVRGANGLEFDEFAPNKNLVYPVESVEELAGLVGAIDDQQINLKGWQPDSGVNGGILYWDSAKLKSEHDGDTVFSPTVPFNSDELIYGAGTGETDPTGAGCWVRVRILANDNEDRIEVLENDSLYIEPDSKVIQSRIRSEVVNNTWGIRTLNILGDSISHGANAPDIPNDSWVGVFRKMVNAEFGANNYGFCSINHQITNPEGTYKELHDVTTSGTWASLNSTTTDDMMNGFAFISSVAGSKLTIAVPQGNKNCRVWYRAFTGGGTFTVSINGVVVDTIDSSDTAAAGEGGFYLTPARPLVDNFYGSAFIVIENISGETQIQGISYLDDKTQAFQLNNFSQSGRKLQHLSDAVITKACTGCQTLIFALGHNDRTATGSDRDKVIENINFLILRANALQAKVFILDFNWHETPDHWLRVELKRAHTEISGAEYIPFPDMFNLDNSPATTAETITELGFLGDSSHPTVFGHSVIAETLAKYMRLSVSSKRQGMMNDPRFTPIKMPSSGWRNGNASKPTAWRRNSNYIEVRFDLRDSFKSSDVIGELPVSVSIESTEVQYFTDATGKSFAMKLNNTSPATLEFVGTGSGAV